MRTIWLYVKALMDYYQTAKARHDLMDYARAGMIILAVMVLVRIVAEWLR